MSDPVPLPDRKALLLARSSLHRLMLVRDAQVLRESLEWKNLASSATASAPMRPLLFGALMLFAGRSRLSRMVGIATRAVMLVKAAQAMIGMARRR